MKKVIIDIENLVNKFGNNVVHDGLSLQVNQHDVLGIIGGSGSGKTVLLSSMLGLHRPFSGTIEIFGHPIRREFDLNFSSRIGALFQQGALFSSLNVFDNIAFSLRQLMKLDEDLIKDTVLLKLQMVGLPPETALKMPAQLSGGMVKRVALARALAHDPELLLVDEPTAGLDPIAAYGFDELILALKHSLNLTVVMITHDLNSIRHICNKLAFIINKKAVVGTLQELENSDNPWIQKYFQKRQD